MPNEVVDFLQLYFLLHQFLPRKEIHQELKFKIQSSKSACEIKYRFILANQSIQFPGILHMQIPSSVLKACLATNNRSRDLRIQINQFMTIFA
jgi:hypothetical protein